MRPLRIALLIFLIQSAMAQSTGPGSIRGVVVNLVTRDPIVQAVVELRAVSDTTGTPITITATQQNGEFVFQSVPSGRYRLAITRTGFAPVLSPPIAVASGQPTTGVQISLAAGAAMSGRITYANGEPLPLAEVQIMKLGYENDGQANLTVVQSTYTNDLGEYRFFWLAPGSYYLSVRNAQNTVSGRLTLNPLGNGSSYWSGGQGGGSRPTATVSRSLGLEEGQSYGTLYYPATPDIGRATPLELSAGAELRNINVTYVPLAPKSTSRIRGVAIDALGQQPIPGRFSGILTPVEPVGADQRGIITLSNGQRGGTARQFFPNAGTFEFIDVGAGTYELRLNADELSGRIVVQVQGRDVELRVPMYPAVSVSGKMNLEGSTTATDWTGLRIRMGTATQSGIAVAANGEFKIPDLAAATYAVEVLMPPSWPDAYVKSIRTHDSDLPDGKLVLDGMPVDPLEVTVHLNGGSIEGRALNALQAIIPNASVILVPDQAAPLRPDQFRTAFTDEAGRFQFHALPAGDYNIYVWEDIEKNAWFGKGFLQTFNSYKRTLRVEDGQKQQIEMKAAPTN